jgi:hypothetical protein
MRPSVFQIYGFESAVNLKSPSFPHGCSGNPGGTLTGPPDPFDVAQGRGEHRRTTIKTFGVTTWITFS